MIDPGAAPGMVRNERGVALPMALLALVSLGVLVTGLVMSSTTEMVLSHAHQDATAGLYAADGAIDSYLGSLGVAEPSLGAQTVTLPDGREVRLTVARLRDRRVVSAGVQLDSQTYWLSARPTRSSGRTVSTLFDRIVQTPLAVPPQNPPLSLALEAAATFGSDLFINGNVTVSGIHRRTCDGTSQAMDTVNAIRFVAGADITNDPNRHVRDRLQENGGIDYYTWGQDSLVHKVLGVDSLMAIARVAEVKFGAKLGQPAFDNSTNPSSSRPKNNPYNWGCAPGRTNCGANGPYAKVVAIDAQGGTVVINGNGDGYGMLVVVNGNLRIAGTFVYHGLVAVEGSTSIVGTADIYGGVISVGLMSVEDNQIANGTPIVKYDKCVLDAVQNHFELMPPPPPGGGTPPPPAQTQVLRRLGWTETVR